MTHYDKVWKWLEKDSASLFEGSHHIHTPKELVESIVTNFNPLAKKKILVLFNVEFVLGLVESGVSSEDIIFLSDSDNKTAMVKRIGVKYIVRSLSMDKGVKIDVIVGNPPFNDSAGDNRTESKNTNNSNLYVDFIEKCLKIVDNGQMVLITPAAWMNKAKIKQKVINAGLRKIKDIDPKYFPGVVIRSGISCLFTETNYDGNVDIETGDTVYTINRHSILNFDNPDKFKLIDRINNGSSFDTLLKIGPYAIPKGTKGSIERLLEKDSSFSEKTDSDHPTKVIIYAGGKDTSERYLFNSSNKSKDKWGVVVPTASDKFIIGAVRIIEPGVGVSDRLKVAYFDSQDEAENVKRYLESKLIRFVVGTTKHNDTVNTNKNSFGNIPLIDFTRSYTDDEIVGLFNLSDKDIDLVNAQ
jgi:site-specific DNA-methyltransferase (adenine-specific)